MTCVGSSEAGEAPGACAGPHAGRCGQSPGSGQEAQVGVPGMGVGGAQAAVGAQRRCLLQSGEGACEGFREDLGDKQQ